MSELKEQLIELFENVSGCSIDEFSEEQLPYLADYIIGQQEADNMCIEKLKKENQRLTEMLEKCIHELEQSYDATEWPADGTSAPEVTARLAREFLSKLQTKTGGN